MRELSLHILDIVQNSITAGAFLIGITVAEEPAEDRIRIVVTDNGCGMSPEKVRLVIDPFYTTRTTRKVGMGIPLFRMAAEMTGGGLTIQSEPGVGTTVTAVFVRSHIDCIPLGDIDGTIMALIRMNPGLDFTYSRAYNRHSFTLDTRSFREILDGVPMDTPEVAKWIAGYLREQTQLLLAPSGGEPEKLQSD